MVINQYKTKEYAFDDYKHLISDINWNLEQQEDIIKDSNCPNPNKFLELLLECAIKVIENATYEDDKDVDVPRFYKHNIVKKNLHKVNIDVLGEKNKDDIKFSKFKYFTINRYNIFSQYVKRKKWSSEVVKKQVDLASVKMKECTNLKIKFCMERVVVTPIESLDLGLEFPTAKNINSLYKNLDAKNINNLIEIVSKETDDSKSVNRCLLRNILSEELLVDTYKYMLTKKTAELKNIYAGCSDMEMSNNIVKNLLCYESPSIFFYLIEDNKKEKFLSQNLYLSILNVISNGISSYKSSKDGLPELKTSFLSFISNLLLFLEEVSQEINEGKIISDKKTIFMYETLFNRVEEKFKQVSESDYLFLYEYMEDINLVIKRITKNVANNKNYNDYYKKMFEIMSNFNDIKKINKLIFNINNSFGDKKSDDIFDIFNYKLNHPVSFDNNYNASYNYTCFNMNSFEDIQFTIDGDKVRFPKEQEVFVKIKLNKMLNTFSFINEKNNIYKYLGIKEISLNNDILELRLDTIKNLPLIKSLPKMFAHILQKVESEIGIEINEIINEYKDGLVDFLNISKSNDRFEGVDDDKLAELMWEIINLKENVYSVERKRFAIFMEYYSAKCISDENERKKLIEELRSIYLVDKLNPTENTENKKHRKKI